jgi:PAS domain S-box-containing protein
MKEKTKSKEQLEKEIEQLKSEIDKLKSAEITRQETEEAYKALIEHSLQGFMIIQDEKIVFANLPFIEMSGYSMGNIFSFTTEDIKTIIHPDDRVKVWSDLKNRIAGKKASPHHEFRFIRKDGSVCWVETLNSFITYRNQPAMQMAFMDISERKQVEVAYRKELKKAQKYLDIAGVMFVVINKEEKVRLINQKGCEILGYSEKEIIDKNWFDNFIPKNIRDDVKSVFGKLMNGEIEPVEYFENPVLTKNGKEKVIEWHNTILTDEEGNISGTLSSGTDISERTNYNQTANNGQ